MALFEQFTTTYVSTVSAPAGGSRSGGITWDGVDAMYCGVKTESPPNYKLWRNSGQFTSTIHDSEQVSSVGTRLPKGISWDGADTTWCTQGSPPKLLLQSGRYTSTIKTSLDIASADVSQCWSCSWDGDDTLVGVIRASDTSKKSLFSLAGQFSTTITNSISYSPTAQLPSGLSAEAANTVFSYFARGYRMSGRYSTTILDSGALGSSIFGPFLEGVGSNQLSIG